MAIIEEVQDEEAAPVVATPSRIEMMSTLRALSAKLRLPEELLPGFMDDEDGKLLSSQASSRTEHAR